MKVHVDRRKPRRSVAQPHLRTYSAAVGAILATGAGAEAAVVWSGPLSLDFGDSHPLLGPIMEGADPEFLFAGNNTGFLVAIVSTGARVLAKAATTAYPTFLRRVSANSESSVGTGFISPGGLGGYFSTTGGLGLWSDGDPHFFAFSFEREGDGTQLFGWGEVQQIDGNDGRILQWAYDDMGAPIKVGDIPEPAAMGLFALGATGLAAYRRRRSAADR